MLFLSCSLGIESKSREESQCFQRPRWSAGKRQSSGQEQLRAGSVRAAGDVGSHLEGAFEIRRHAASRAEQSGAAARCFLMGRKMETVMKVTSAAVLAALLLSGGIALAQSSSVPARNRTPRSIRRRLSRGRESAQGST